MPFTFWLIVEVLGKICAVGPTRMEVVGRYCPRRLDTIERFIVGICLNEGETNLSGAVQICGPEARNYRVGSLDNLQNLLFCILRLKKGVRNWTQSCSSGDAVLLL